MTELNIFQGDLTDISAKKRITGHNVSCQQIMGCTIIQQKTKSDRVYFSDDFDLKSSTRWSSATSCAPVICFGQFIGYVTPKIIYF